MLLAKVLDKLFNRRNTFEIESLEGDIPASIKEQIITLITPLIGTSLKAGSYIFNSESGMLEYVEVLPEDYTGILYCFGDDMLDFEFFNDGIYTSSSSIGFGGISTPMLYAEEINFVQLTHSFNELDPTLKALCESAINAQTPVSCTQQQWNTIKKLLDKSLYFNYNGISMIKSIVDGIDMYSFGGCSGTNFGFKITFQHFPDDTLYISYEEL